MRYFANEVLFSLGIMVAGLILITGLYLSPFPIGGGFRVRVIPWGVFVFGFYRLLDNLVEWRRQACG